MWPNSYAGRRKHYDYEGQERASAPGPVTYGRTRPHGISMRNYGYFVDNLEGCRRRRGSISGVRDPILSHVTNPRYRAFDLFIPTWSA
jgi:hypothetical protein